ncbi:MAG: aldo/keto reductase [Dehalococcoidia bacterium]|nr:aldo/keto reductase [Dehalococcoidia bacterium]
MAQGLATAILGRTGREVTRLGFGAMEIRGEPRGRAVTDKQAETILNAVLDAGITFIDTARSYGLSEEYIGKYISNRQSEYFLATKGGRYQAGETDWTQEHLLRGMDESLHRLQVDHVDTLQLHSPTVAEAEKGNLVEGLRKLREQGKVLWLGASTRLPDLPTFLDWGVFDVFQIPYSALERAHEDLITKAAEAGIGTVIRGGVAKGEPGSGRGSAEVWGKFDEANLDEFREAGESRTSFMLRFTLTHPHVHTIIVGTQRPDHLHENIQAAQRGPLTEDVYAEAKRRLDAVGISPAPDS